MKKVVIVLSMLMWSNPGIAACVTTIPASTPTADFTDNGDGTITHNKTGLMWKKCSEGQSGAGCATGVAAAYTWQGALQQAAGVFAGYTDWRLPNIKELESIVETQCSGPAINATIFPATPSRGYWSSSPYAALATGAWVVGFSNGYDYVLNKSTNNSVRLVRGGQ